MSKTKGRRSIWLTLLLVLNLAVSTANLPGGAAQRARRSKRARAEEPTPVLSKPQLINVDTNPTLRFSVARFVSGGARFWLNPLPVAYSVFTYGWLDVSRDRVSYHVIQPGNRERDGFETAREAVTGADFNYGILSFRAVGKAHQFRYVPEDQWGTLRYAYDDTAKMNAPTTRAIYNAITGFDAALAAVVPPAPAVPAAAITQPISSPSSAPPPPTIVLLEPSVGNSGQTLEVTATTLSVRGVAMDTSGLPLVTINGNPANMKPRNAQAVEFWSDPIALEPGDNKCEIIASNAAHAEATFTFTAHLTPPSPPKPWKPTSPNPVPLSKPELLGMIKSMPTDQVMALLKENGINFAPTADDLKEIRDAGGNDNLIETLKLAEPVK